MTSVDVKKTYNLFLHKFFASSGTFRYQDFCPVFFLRDNVRRINAHKPILERHIIRDGGIPQVLLQRLQRFFLAVLRRNVPRRGTAAGSGQQQTKEDLHFLVEKQGQRSANRQTVLEDEVHAHLGKVRTRYWKKTTVTHDTWGVRYWKKTTVTHTWGGN